MFLEEKSNSYRIRVLVSILISAAIVIALTIIFLGSIQRLFLGSSYLGPLVDWFYAEVYEFSMVGLFLAGFVGGLFFIPLPQEIFFYYGLLKGNPVLLSFIFVNLGYFFSQALNYFIGLRLSGFFIYLASRKKVYRARRFVNKYGSWGVFVFNVLPLPAPVLTFALGVTKYNVYRLFFFTFLGTFIKYSVVIIFFYLTS